MQAFCGTVKEPERTLSESALSDLVPSMYADLHRLAARHLRNERAGHTLQPTALLHEAYLKLSDDGQRRFNDRTRFYSRKKKMDLPPCGA